MSKITNAGFTRSGTGCFIVVPVCQQWASKGYFWQFMFTTELVAGVILAVV